MKVHPGNSPYFSIKQNTENKESLVPYGPFPHFNPPSFAFRHGNTHQTSDEFSIMIKEERTSQIMFDSLFHVRQFDGSISNAYL